MVGVGVGGGGLKIGRHAISVGCKLSSLSVSGDIIFPLRPSYRFLESGLIETAAGRLSQSSRQPADGGLGDPAETKVLSETVAKGPGPAGEGP